MSEEKNGGVADWWKSIALLAIGALGSGSVIFIKDYATRSSLDTAVQAEANLRKEADDNTRADVRDLRLENAKTRDDITAIKATLDTLASVMRSPPATATR